MFILDILTHGLLLNNCSSINIVKWTTKKHFKVNIIVVPGSVLVFTGLQIIIVCQLDGFSMIFVLFWKGVLPILAYLNKLTSSKSSGKSNWTFFTRPRLLANLCMGPEEDRWLVQSYLTFFQEILQCCLIFNPVICGFWIFTNGKELFNFW